MSSLSELMATLPHCGTVEWIGIRPARRAPMRSLSRVQCTLQSGLEGDHYAGQSGDRQVTLLQYEHLAVIASLSGHGLVHPATLRRNIVVSGINLRALKGRRFRVGSAELDYTALCHPCSRMEQVLGPGGYNAMRGHGGITARVIAPGVLSIGDSLCATRSAADSR